MSYSFTMSLKDETFRKLIDKVGNDPEAIRAFIHSLVEKSLESPSESQETA